MPEFADTYRTQTTIFDDRMIFAVEFCMCLRILDRIELIEIYYKGDKENEDRERIFKKVGSGALEGRGK